MKPTGKPMIDALRAGDGKGVASALRTLKHIDAWAFELLCRWFEDDPNFRRWLPYRLHFKKHRGRPYKSGAEKDALGRRIVTEVDENILELSKRYAGKERFKTTAIRMVAEYRDISEKLVWDVYRDYSKKLRRN